MTTAMSPFAKSIYLAKYAARDDKGELVEHDWSETARRVVPTVLAALGYGPESDEVVALTRLVEDRKFIPGGRYLYATGKDYHQTNNCLLLRAEDSREGWADLFHKAAMSLQTGAGIGVDYSAVRPKGSRIKRTGGIASGPIELMKAVNELGRSVMQGGNRRSAIWAGLKWSHPDVFDFIHLKDWPEYVRAAKERDYNAAAPMDMTNISVLLDDEFFEAYHDHTHVRHQWAAMVMKDVVAQMFRTGEPGFSVNLGENVNSTLRNACCEVVSEDDSDVCNLGSINLARIESLEEMREVTRLGSLFLLAGTVYSDVPYAKVAETRAKNRRLGLGLMGLHEFLLMRGLRYEPSAELGEYLDEYAQSGKFANAYADRHGLSRPVATRAIAPTGCQRPDTMVVTEDGILELGEIGRIEGEQWQSLGLNVSQEDGTDRNATRFFVNGVADTKKITLSSGQELEATPNHQYRCLVDGKYVWRRTDEMQVGDCVVVALGTYRKETEPELLPVRPWYRTEARASFPTHMTPDLARFIGTFVADGSIHHRGIRIACNAKHPEEYQAVAALGESLFGVPATFSDNGRNCMSVCFSSSMLLRWLYLNGLDKRESREAEIPVIIRCSSKQSISAFLQGYWEADGSESVVKYIDTASPRLAQQLMTVIRALGSDAAINSHVSGMGSTIYRVRWVTTQRKCVTAAIRQQLHNLGLASCVVDTVKAIEDGRCMTLDIEVPETVTYIANGVVSHNTIAICAETTTGIEPVFCVAYKRRYLDAGKVWKYQYVVDPTAQKLVAKGIDPDSVEDAYVLSLDMERRVRFQAWLQGYVDMSISSTINMPAWGTPANDETMLAEYERILVKHLPKLRGITVYPDGARGGQPLVPCTYAEAAGKEGVVFEESDERCLGGVCGA